jgi:diguanylate cyclase (GGDEF)-like protein
MKALMKLVQHLPDGSDSTSQEQLIEIRNQLLDKSLTLILIFIIPALVFSFLRAETTGWQPVMCFHIFIAVLLVVCIGLKRRLALQYRIWLILGSLFLSGIGGLITYGLIGAGVLILATVCLAFTIFSGLRTGLISVITSILIIIATAIAVQMEVITYSFDFNVYARDISSWGTILLGFIIFVGFLTLITGMLNHNLIELVNISNQRSHDLTNRTNQLIKNQLVLLELAREEFTDLSAAFNKIVRADAEQLSVERVSIWFFNQAHNEIICKALYQDGKTSNEVTTLSAKNYPRYFEALSHKGFIMANDACNNPYTSEFAKDYLIPLGIKSMMDIPIHFKGEIIGIVCHEQIGSLREWSLEDEDFAKSISDMCALAMAEFENKKTEQKLSYQASHDVLTGLVNRREFESRAEHLIQESRNHNSEHALCFMDLDQFKVVNDTCGHIAGDELLHQLSSVLSLTIRQQDTLARLGGDEFGVLIENCSLENAQQIASKLLQAIQGYQFLWEGNAFKVGASIGLVSLTSSTNNLTQLLKDADAACYMAKDKGRNRIHVYHVDDAEIAQRHGEIQWVAKINEAIDKDRFCLYAQAIVSLDNSEETHYELLIRMMDENMDIVPPGYFLPAAERYNLITTLDRWVITNAFDLLLKNPEFLNNINFISINISGPSLADTEFLAFVSDKFKTTKLQSDKICFEITETAAISNLNTASVFISSMKELGCQFALDDFGSGLSSFGYLKSLPVDYLKIDGMFVKDIVQDKIDRAMVKSINEIGHVMGMKTIAEFVENDIIRGMLQEIGVNYVQGYGVDKPQLFNNLIKASNNIVNVKFE